MVFFSWFEISGHIKEDRGHIKEDRAVQAWKAHLLRSVNQEEVKQNALTQLDEEWSLIIMAWAMKYLPQHSLKSYIWVTYIMRQKQVKKQ